MKNPVLHFLSFIIFASSFSPLSSLANSNNRSPANQACINGECIEELVDNLKQLSSVYQEQCLPKNIDRNQIEKHHEKNGLTEECWKYITEINHLEAELEKHKTRLESRLGCEAGNCNSSGEDINSKLNQLSEVEEKLSCTEVKKNKIQGECASDMNCVMISTAFTIGGYLAEKLIPKNYKPKNCNLGDDSCLTRLATGFLRASITFFDGAWDLLKLAGRKIGEKASQFWSWVKGAEDHSATSQLAMAKASEDPGVFDMLIKDFPGTMGKVWSAFVAAMKEWLTSNVFCQKWSGVPHLSTCLQPTDSFKCISCKTMINGLCAASGALIAEVVPAFLTGGLLTAAKYGVSGASKISKVFKVSGSGMASIKSSRIGKMTMENTGKIDDVLKISQGLRVAKVAVEKSLQLIKSYLLSPIRKSIKTSATALSSLVRKGRVFVAHTKTGKILIFPGTVLKTTFNVIIYPIDNPITTFAFKAGVRSFEKAFNYGPPKLLAKTTVTTAAIAKEKNLEQVFAKIEEAKASGSVSSEKLVALEEELLEKLQPHRSELTQKLLPREDVELSEIISELYPELKYSDLAEKIKPQKIGIAERSLYLEISAMKEGETKARLLRAFNSHVSQGKARSRFLKDPFNYKLGSKKSITESIIVTPRKLSPTEVTESKKAITQYMNTEYQAMVKRADELEKSIRKNQNNVYDVVAIGAGPHNSIATMAIRETNPKLKVIVIESTENLGVFHRIKGFDINTSEFRGRSGNTFPGAPAQLKDFNIGGKRFASAEELGQLTQATYQSSEVSLILKNSVTKWFKEPKPGTWPAKYRIETDNGLIIYTNSGIAGTGFGAPITRLKDPGSIEIVSKYENQAAKINLAEEISYAPKIQSVDDFLTLAAMDAKNARQAVSRYKGNTVLVVGSGDGGNIVIEATTGLNKALNPNNVKTDIHSIWLGQELRNGSEFLASLSGRKLPRYAKIAKALDDGRVTPVNGYLSKLEEVTTKSGEIQFKAHYTAKDGSSLGDPVLVDNVVFATGYLNDHSGLKSIFTPLLNKGDNTSAIILEPFVSDVGDYSRYLQLRGEHPIGQRVFINGHAEDIFTVGQVSKLNISDADWAIPVGGFIDILAPKSAATGKIIAQKLSPQNLTRDQIHALLTPAPGEKLKVIKMKARPDSLHRPVIDNPAVADLDTRLQLSKNLRNFKLQPNAEFKIKIIQNPEGGYIYEVHGLNAKSSQDLVSTLYANEAFNHSINSQFKLQRTELNIRIRARENGLIKMEDLAIHGQLSLLETPFLMPTNVAEGIRRGAMPLFRSGNAVDKQLKKENAE